MAEAKDPAKEARDAAYAKLGLRDQLAIWSHKFAFFRWTDTVLFDKSDGVKQYYNETKDLPATPEEEKQLSPAPPTAEDFTKEQDPNKDNWKKLAVRNAIKTGVPIGGQMIVVAETVHAVFPDSTAGKVAGNFVKGTEVFSDITALSIDKLLKYTFRGNCAIVERQIGDKNYIFAIRLDDTGKPVVDEQPMMIEQDKPIKEVFLNRAVYEKKLGINIQNVPLNVQVKEAYAALRSGELLKGGVGSLSVVGNLMKSNGGIASLGLMTVVAGGPLLSIIGSVVEFIPAYGIIGTIVKYAGKLGAPIAGLAIAGYGVYCGCIEAKGFFGTTTSQKELDCTLNGSKIFKCLDERARKKAEEEAAKQPPVVTSEPEAPEVAPTDQTKAAAPAQQAEAVVAADTRAPQQPSTATTVKHPPSADGAEPTGQATAYEGMIFSPSKVNLGPAIPGIGDFTTIVGASRANPAEVATQQ